MTIKIRIRRMFRKVARIVTTDIDLDLEYAIRDYRKFRANHTPPVCGGR